jgi:hypothetical protein
MLSIMALDTQCCLMLIYHWYVECGYAECHYAECRSPECHGAIFRVTKEKTSIDIVAHNYSAKFAQFR